MSIFATLVNMNPSSFHKMQA